MRIDDYSRLLRAYGLVLVITVLLGLAGGFAASLLQTPKYKASAELYVGVQQATNLADFAQGTTLAESLVRNYSQVVTTQLILDPVIQTLDLKTTAGTLARQVSVTSPLDTSIIEIDVLDTSPTRAARIADSIARTLTSTVPDLTPSTADSALPVRVTLLQSAVAPTSPAVPNVPLDLGIGVVIALALLILILLVRNALRQVAAQRVLADDAVLE